MSHKQNNMEIELNTANIIKFVLVIAGIMFGFFILIQGMGGTKASNSQDTEQVSKMLDTTGKQVVEMTAGFSGYLPSILEIKSDTPTILRVKSTKNFGCGSAFRIPKLNISANLPANGTMDFDLGTLTAGTTFDGLCAMGMYRINFKVV
jgi:plastocyanin domain-containing protein